jgi:hypothetical protein
MCVAAMLDILLAPRKEAAQQTAGGGELGGCLVGRVPHICQQCGAGNADNQRPLLQQPQALFVGNDCFVNKQFIMGAEPGAGPPFATETTMKGCNLP